ncbi:hypothetical protein PPYR_13166 [Photinus pyralis]|uniref:FGFR1 oncogene partner (FOP) N-terminal dimerisation domain-containing protein n=2 Tax=Photinus pyralis TaxID=7054 RepID=A0A5N4A890_PHOPY|nr:lisH domain-containing protein FOPNL-like [Photinus pyralis]KAB0793546.1 hypothetical protein PPYR_13166 [Photinus pyralis]
MSDPMEDHLFKEVKRNLEVDGRLQKFTAELRSTLISILNGRPPRDQNYNEIPKETRLINDLIREYLIWNGYIYTEEFLVAESGAEKEKPSREDLTEKLGIADDYSTTKIPLLYYIVCAFEMQEQST